MDLEVEVDQLLEEVAISEAVVVVAEEAEEDYKVVHQLWDKRMSDRILKHFLPNWKSQGYQGTACMLMNVIMPINFPNEKLE